MGLKVLRCHSGEEPDQLRASHSLVVFPCPEDPGAWVPRSEAGATLALRIWLDVGAHGRSPHFFPAITRGCEGCFLIRSMSCAARSSSAQQTSYAEHFSKIHSEGYELIRSAQVRPFNGDSSGVVIPAPSRGRCATHRFEDTSLFRLERNSGSFAYS